MTRQQAIALNHNLFNHFIGMETIARELDRMTTNHVIEKYPPHNIIKTDENKYVVELATAGFKQDELAVVVEDKVLKISGEQLQIQDVEYLQKGISTKSFVKTIPLIDTVEVRGAEYVDGILRVSLENVIPPEKQPKNIPILGMNQEQILLTE
jgi:molecular chaperone IbpA